MKDIILSINNFYFSVPYFLLIDAETYDESIPFGLWLKGKKIRTDEIIIESNLVRDYQNAENYYLKLPLEIEWSLIEDFFTIKPFNINIIDEKRCKNLFLQQLFSINKTQFLSIQDFINFHLTHHQNPLEIIAMMQMYVSNNDRSDIETLHIKSQTLKYLNDKKKEVENLTESINKLKIIVDENDHQELKNLGSINTHIEVAIHGYKFLVPNFLLWFENEIQNYEHNYYYSKLLNGAFLSKESVNIDYLIIDTYKLNCLERHSLPIILDPIYYETENGFVGTIKPIDLDSFTEEQCDEYFIEHIFKDIVDYDNFVNNQILNNINPLAFLHKIHSLITNVEKNDIKSLRVKKDILNAINSAIAEIENLNTSVQELQSPTLPIKSKEGSHIESTINQFTWSEPKTDLAELVYALAKTKRIESVKTGKPATKEELLIFFSELFGQDITAQSLLSKSKKTYKKTTDLNTFTRKLADIVDSYLKE